MQTHSFRSSKLPQLATLALIVVAYLVVATLYAVKTPAWQVPDEPAHYNYARQVAMNGCCPVLQPGDWDNNYLDSIKAQKFSTASLQGRLDTVQYEDHQPPLYYLIEAPVYSASNGNLTAMRMLSVVLGAGIIIVAWAVVRVVFPAQPWLALATAAFVAFVPQHVAMMAGVENDSLAELLLGLTLLACALYLKRSMALTPDSSPAEQGESVSTSSPSPRTERGAGGEVKQIHPLVFGILLGLTFITKITVIPPAVVIVGLSILLRARREHWSAGRFGREIAWTAIPALIFGLPLWVRNLSVYGGLDFLAQSAHDRVVVGQLRTDQYILDHGFTNWLTDFGQTSFHSFWGQFGWMGYAMTPQIYTALAAFTGFVIVGAGIAFARWRKRLSDIQRDMLFLFGITALLALAELIYWNLKFVQFQGRYLYPGLIPIALFVAIGLSGWPSLIRVRYIQWATVVGLFGFAVLDVYVLFKIIIPALG